MYTVQYIYVIYNKPLSAGTDIFLIYIIYRCTFEIYWWVWSSALYLHIHGIDTSFMMWPTKKINKYDGYYYDHKPCCFFIWI